MPDSFAAYGTIKHQRFSVSDPGFTEYLTRVKFCRGWIFVMIKLISWEIIVWIFHLKFHPSRLRVYHTNFVVQQYLFGNENFSNFRMTLIIQRLRVTLNNEPYDIESLFDKLVSMFDGDICLSIKILLNIYFLLLFIIFRSSWSTWRWSYSRYF